MLKLYKVNPLVRAIGTMGAVAALVGGVTFATASSNPTTTVTLTDNTASSLTANLAIADGSNCTDVTTQTDAGFTFNKLVPGTPSSAFDFCFNNTASSTDKNAGFMDVTMQSAAAITGTTNLNPSDVTLNVTCGTNPMVSTTLDKLFNPATPLDLTGTTHLAPGTPLNCAATAELSSGYTGPGGSINSFTLDFVGTADAS